MTLKPLMPKQFAVIKPLLADRLKESHLENQTTPDFLVAKLTSLYELRSAGVYVDDVTNPSHMLVMTHFPGLWVDGVVATIALIYTKPELRGNMENMAILYRTAENYARLNGATTLQGSSWVFEGSKATDALWVKNGFSLQSHSYTKQL